MILWGASWISTKVLTNYINAYEMVFLRMGICFISMAPIIFFTNMKFRLDLKTSVLILFASFFLVLYSIFMFWGVEHGTGSLGGAMVPSMIPIITYIFVAILNRKTISLKHSFALILGVFGVLNMINIYQFSLEAIFDSIEEGDLEAGLKAASAIGDDTLQKQAQGYVVPDSFTHGTSNQRMEALKKGFYSGDIKDCSF